MKRILMAVLIKWEQNWADEFDMTGFQILSDEDYNRFIDRINNADYPVEASFGTNESYEFESIEDITRSIDAITLTEKEAETFSNLFGEKFYSKDFGFGWTPIIVFSDY